ncbi:unnamed protein product, partial [Owenia fusiformis]
MTIRMVLKLDKMSSQILTKMARYHVTNNFSKHFVHNFSKQQMKTMHSYGVRSPKSCLTGDLERLLNQFKQCVRRQSIKEHILRSNRQWIPRVSRVATLLCIPSAVLVKYNLRLVECKANYSRVVEKSEIENEPVFDWGQFMKILLPELAYLIAAVVAAFAVAIVNIQMPLYLGELVNVLSEFTKEGTQNYVEHMKKPALKLIGFYVTQGVLTFSYISLLSAVGERVATRMRQQLFNSLISQDISFYDSHKTGELINRLTADVQDFKSSFKMCISQGLRSLTQTLGCVVSLFMISPMLTGSMVVIVPTIIGAGALIGSILRSMSREAQAQVAKATSIADEAIGNVRTVRAFAMEPKEIELYNQEVELSSQLNTKLGVGIGLFQGLSNFALNGIVLGVLYVGGSLMSSNKLSAGELMSFLVATQTIQRSLAQMSLLFGQTVRGLSAGARVFEYLNIQPEIHLNGGTTIPHHTLIGNVEFKNVSFVYPTRKNQTVLKDFSLKVDGGKVVALVGLSGGGKSTIAALLERFYDVSGGSITLDNHDIRELDPSWMRGHVIGFINQEPVLFATSVLENIRYGRPDATDSEVFEAAKQANAHTFIERFPEGYKTVLGERGVTVSGGQKQRIAIARALIKNPTILILDEATSALDAESERIVQEALDNATKGRTVLVIAHRLSTIQNADLIAVVSHGAIKEMGTHGSLKRKRGLYWELIKMQQQEE